MRMSHPLTRYAMQQGDMAVKYVVCQKSVWEACGLKGGQARMVRYDLPTAHNKTGIMLTTPVTDVRAFHIFSRGSSLPPFLELKSTPPISHYNAATIPMVFVVYNFGHHPNATYDAKAEGKAVALDYHDVADQEDLLELGLQTPCPPACPPACLPAGFTCQAALAIVATPPLTTTC